VLIKLYFHHNPHLCMLAMDHYQLLKQYDHACIASSFLNDSIKKNILNESILSLDKFDREK
jgi:hypothetical protein